MIYDTNDPREYLQAKEWLAGLKERGRPARIEIESENFDVLDSILQSAAAAHLEIEIKQRRRPKTPQQNNYLHFLCQYFASEYGCTTADAKENYLKRLACPEIFTTYVRNKRGWLVTTYRSVADLTQDEMSSAIRNFIEWAGIKGIEMPLPEDKAFIRYAKNEIERTRNYI